MELHEAFNKAKHLFNIEEDISPSQSFYSTDELRNILNNADFNISVSEKYEKEYFRNCKEFLYSVKKIGANNSGSNRKKTNPDFIQKVMDIYDHDYLEKDQVRATYHNIFSYMKHV